jgi:hypothetical protein
MESKQISTHAFPYLAHFCGFKSFVELIQKISKGIFGASQA